MTTRIKNIQDIQVPNNLSANDSIYLDYFNIQTNLVRYLYIKIEILDKTNKIINEVSGTAIGGNYNINSESAVRRTCDLTFRLESGYLPSDENSMFWINKKFHLYIGLKNMQQNKMYWFDKGIYAIKDPEISITINDNTIKISGLDKMALYSGDIGGQLQSATLATVDSGVTRGIAIRSVMTNAGEDVNKIFIQDTDSKVMELPIPYDIESSIGDCTTDILDKFIELFANYQYYYDLNGNFMFTPKPTNSNFHSFPTEWDFTKYNNLIISINRNVEYSNVKNRITIWGGVHDDGYQPHYTLTLEDSEDFSNSPFTATQLGETHSDGTLMYRDYVEQNDDYVDAVLTFDTSDNTIIYPYNICVKYNDVYYLCVNKDGTDNSQTPLNNTKDWEKICTTAELEEFDDETLDYYMQKIHAYSINLCKEKANEMAFYYHYANDKISITCIPIYSLDVNSIIEIDDEVRSGASGKYIVTAISCQLGANGTMNITANKLL